MGNTYNLLTVYRKEIKDEIRYIFFDIDTLIPYFYSPERLQPCKLHMNDDSSDSVKVKDIQYHCEKHGYEMICVLEFIRHNQNQNVVKYDNMDICQFKRHMNEMINKSISLSNWDRNVSMMCRKISSVLKDI